MPIIKKQDYLNRDFESIRTEIEVLLQTYFPNEWQDFNVSSAGMALIDLLAYVSDLLSFYTDKRFNQLFLDGVGEAASAFRLAKTLGYKVPGTKGSSTLVDIIIIVPATSTGPDVSYLPQIRPGARLSGLGQNFETFNEIDFSNDFSGTGVANRKIDAIFDASQNITGYKVTKREFCVAGTTTFLRKTINQEDASTEFLEVTLLEANVTEILDVIAVTNNDPNFSPTYTDFKNFDFKYHEVDHLADNQIFLDSISQSSGNFASGRWVTVNKRFTKEFLSNGSCKLTFGAGTPDVDAYARYLNNLSSINSKEINFKDVIDNKSLGEKLPPNSSLFIKYRVGGGEVSNLGARVLNGFSNIDALILGTNAATNDRVLASIRGTNIIPALGGRNLPSISEIRYAASSNFASQERCVTLDDYISRIKQMPGRFGAPFRINGRIDDNKVQLYVISKDANGKLTESVPSLVKENMIEYLSRFRMINDFVEINSAKVINLMFEVDLFVDNSFNSNEIRLEALEVLKDYFDIEKWELNQPIFISQLVDVLRDIPGVINVVDIVAYNLDGGIYSRTLTSQANGPTEFLSASGLINQNGDLGVRKTLITYIDNAILSTPLSMFEIKLPDVDIRVRTSQGQGNFL